MAGVRTALRERNVAELDRRREVHVGRIGANLDELGAQTAGCRTLGDEITAIATGDTVTPWPPENLHALDGSAAAWCGGSATASLETIVGAARQLTPGTQVGICVPAGVGAWTTIAGTDPFVFTLDDLQRDLDEGPSLTVVREEHTVIIDDAESEHRWPRFVPRAVDLGLRSFLGVRIAAGSKTLGALNLYSTEHTSLSGSRLAHATLFAAHAATALEQAQRENDLVLALQSSRTIGKAIGLVMERFDLDDHEAFAYLARWSEKANLNLREISEHLVNQSNDLRHFTEKDQPLYHPPSGLTLVPSRDSGHEGIDAPRQLRAVTQPDQSLS
jgi:GAF domain-containing protein